MLFPNIILDMAKAYNNAYVLVEVNDIGEQVASILQYDLEYENMHVESAIKANALGIEMTRKVKRLGCSSFKDILENNKLEICDDDTILEISTFVAKGVSYEASTGNHDDLVMNFVMLGYFISTQYFTDMTDINLKEMMFKHKMKEIEDDLPPFGYIDDGLSSIPNEEEREGRQWAIEYAPDI